MHPAFRLLLRVRQLLPVLLPHALYPVVFQFLKQYNDRILQFQQNQLFEVNRRQFYKELDDPRGSDQPTPDANEAREFWINIGTGQWNTEEMLVG